MTSDQGGSWRPRANPATAMPDPVRRIDQRRMAREWKTVMAMIRIYCRHHHGAALCVECEALANYASVRLDRCRFAEDKPTCARCPVHCYSRNRREQIRTVMRYAGPRMVWRHPWLSLCHVLDGWLRARPSAATAEAIGSDAPTVDGRW